MFHDKPGTRLFSLAMRSQMSFPWERQILNGPRFLANRGEVDVNRGQRQFNVATQLLFDLVLKDKGKENQLNACKYNESHHLQP